MNLTLIAQPFDDPSYGAEVKFDGYRAEVVIGEGGQISVIGRRGTDFTARFPELQDLRECLPGKHLVLDGEVVVFDELQRPDFNALQRRYRSLKAKERVAFVAFDLLFMGSRDLCDVPLFDRQQRLQRLIPHDSHRLVRSRSVVGRGIDVFRFCEQQRLEGAVLKDLRSHYLPGRRSRLWCKVRTAWGRRIVTDRGRTFRQA